MQRRFFSFSMALLALSGVLSALGASAQQQVTLRVMTHNSFSLPKETLAQFEKKAGVKLQIAKGGSAGEMLNKLILTRNQPIADVAYGIDNTLLPRAQAAGIIDPYLGPAARRKAAAPMDDKADATTGKAVAQQLVDAAHIVCPYSNATRNNINVTLNVIT